MNNDIAIIGISGRFPEARDLKEFYKNLKQGRDSSRQLSKERISQTTISPEKTYRSFAYIDEIDKFDHRFFNISLREAEQMDPHQRMLLEETYLALESTGYFIDHFRDTNTGVFLSSMALNYYEHAEIFDPNLVTGNSNAIASGRLSRFFNLKGKSLVVDTACSSSLVAVHLACNDLIMGEIEMAVVGSANLILFPTVENHVVNIGTSSRDGKTRSFSSEADGAGSGELVGCVILKKLEEAVKDKDIIYGVIKGTSTNQDAHLSGSLTSPSSIAQSEVIIKAWEKAAVAPQDISFVEAHGSATKLGDPNEVAGMDLAFKKHTQTNQFCAISSVKSNIGHTNNSAGMAGLIKAVLSLQHKELFPSVNYKTPNPFINFSKSAVYVNDVLRKWNVVAVRTAGVSSFGISGTNCHIVLQEYQKDEKEKCQESKDSFFFPISGKSFEALKRNTQVIINFLKETTYNLKDLSFTLNNRKQYEFRTAVLARDKATLIELLEDMLSIEKRNTQKKHKIVFVFSETKIISSKDIADWASYYPVFNECVNAAKEIIKEEGKVDENKLSRFLFQISFYKLLHAFGIRSKNLVGFGIGKIVIEVITEKIDFKTGLKKALDLQEEKHIDLEERIEKLIDRETSSENVVFLEMGPLGNLSEIMSSIKRKEQLHETLYLKKLEKEGFKMLFKEWYLFGLPIQWEVYIKILPGMKIPLPGYQFDKKRCWIKKENTNEIKENVSVTHAKKSTEKRNIEDDFDIALMHMNESWSDTQNKIAKIWMWLLKLETVSLDDNFFTLGGHSLYSIHMINKIYMEFGIKLNFNIIFSFSTLKALSEYIDAEMQKPVSHASEPALVPIPEKEYYETTRAQKRLWLLDNFEEEKANYIVPCSFLFKGKLDIEALKKTFSMFIERHESLRSIFVFKEGILKQKIVAYQDLNFKVEFQDIKDEAGKEQKKEAISYEAYNQPFDLENGPLIRVKVIRIDEDEYLILIIIHHIVTDGWSIEILRIELKSIYDALVNNKELDMQPLKIQAKDYAAWSNQLINSERFNAHKRYWLDQYKDNLNKLNLPLDFERPEIKSPYGKYIFIEIEDEFTQKIKEFNVTKGVTLYMTVYAVMYALLYRYTGEEDIVLGAYVSGRDRPELENQFGFYVNTLAIRTKFDKNDTFSNLLLRTKFNLINAYDHQLYELDMLVEDLKLKRKTNRNPLFDVAIEYKNTYNFLSNPKETRAFLNEAILSDEDIEWCTSKTDITVRIYEIENTYGLKFEYNPELFTRETIELFKDRFLKIVHAVIENPQIKISEISFSSPEKKKEVNFNLFKTNFNYENR